MHLQVDGLGGQEMPKMWMRVNQGKGTGMLHPRKTERNEFEVHVIEEGQ